MTVDEPEIPFPTNGKKPFTSDEFGRVSDLLCAQHFGHGPCGKRAVGYAIIGGREIPMCENCMFQAFEDPQTFI
jgi:hypothetical protein